MKSMDEYIDLCSSVQLKTIPLYENPSSIVISHSPEYSEQKYVMPVVGKVLLPTRINSATSHV